MPDIYGILNVARGALLTQQKAIDVTGHNIANVNTPGYSRQRVNMETNTPIPFAPGQMGTGVNAVEIQRIYDRFLGVQISNENQNLGRWEAQKECIEKAEMILDETSGYGLSHAMSEFWNAWQDLANNPAGHAERTSLKSKSETLANTFNKIYSDLKQIQKDTDDSLKGTIQEINLIADQIADLNQQISQIEVTGQNANDLRDSRDLLLNELSSMIDINTSEGENGEINVSVSGGRPLVQGNSSWNLSTETNGSGLQDIVWLDGSGNPTNITDGISGGQLKGWVEARDASIPGYLSRLDDLVTTLISEVNTLHQSGFDLNSNSGEVFFAGTSAADIAVNSDIVNDVNRIAASGTAGGVPGDNSMAVAIAELQYALTMSGGTATFDDYYNSIVSDVGNDGQTASTHFDHQTSMVTQLNNYRESISGVSLDEEMINLIKFQHAYDAAAKLITTVDELLNTVINMV
jgi:flagellar hook-associated protein 1 FlgK